MLVAEPNVNTFWAVIAEYCHLSIQTLSASSHNQNIAATDFCTFYSDFSGCLS